MINVFNFLAGRRLTFTMTKITKFTSTGKLNWMDTAGNEFYIFFLIQVTLNPW